MKFVKRDICSKGQRPRPLPGSFNNSSPQKGARSHKKTPSQSDSFFAHFRAFLWPTPSGFFPAAAPEASTIHCHKKAQEVTKKFSQSDSFFRAFSCLFVANPSGFFPAFGRMVQRFLATKRHKKSQKKAQPIHFFFRVFSRLFVATPSEFFPAACLRKQACLSICRIH